MVPFGFVVTLILARVDLGLPNDIARAYDTTLRIIGTVILIRFVNRVGARFLVGLVRRSGTDDLQQLLQSIFPLLRALVWGIGSLVLLQSLGVKMTVIWGLLSAGGIGIGLALKEPAQELFAYLMILLDKPSLLVSSFRWVQHQPPLKKLVFAPPICAAFGANKW